MTDTNGNGKGANWIAKGCEFKYSDTNSTTRHEPNVHTSIQ